MRKRLGAAPNRTHADGSPFYTLPIIQDASTGEIVGDSFEIALYLDRTYAAGPRLIPAGSVGLHAAFNVQVDAVFTGSVILCVQGMPFNPETAAQSQATFLQRAGRTSWEEMGVTGPAREEVLKGFNAALEELAKAYRFSGGPFLEGDVPSYADLIVGGWLQFYKTTLDSKEWADLQSWQGGLWGRVHRALEKYADVK